ncbi:MAG TPA: alpha/beta hydrolase [Chthoniobacterales bacterium]|jgi:predicted esterase|nr:alpha/beta hydrolase [Chthoniobacterales bacterium]
MNSTDFIHAWRPGTSGRTLLMLHGTGGTENDLLPLGRALDPEANLLSPRGKVLENGMPRFFRRLAEGVFDEEDLKRRTHELADFIGSAATEYGFNQKQLVAVGYSNGANIAGALLLLRPGTLGAAALMRAMVPLIPDSLPNLDGTPVLLAEGTHDPIVSVEEARELSRLLTDAGARVTDHFEDAGHGLTESTVTATKRWLVELQYQ